MLQRILDSHHSAGEFVGGRIALEDRDGAVTEVSEGTQTIDPDSAPVDVDTPWNIGSSTKTFVAVVVLQLVDEGRLSLDETVERFVPNLAGADRITVRELLQHTSGLHEYADEPVVVNDQKRFWTPDELIAVAEAAGPVADPGSGFHYANTNYIVLGEIIQNVTGHSWDYEVHTRIAEPLGMTHTALAGADLAPGFVPADGGFVDVTFSMDPSVGGSAGALVSNNADLLRFMTALADGELLSPESQKAMETFVPGNDYSEYGITHRYGLGLESYSTDAITVLGHMGTGPSHESFMGFDAAHGDFVAVTLNTNNPGPQAFMALETLTAAAAG